MFRDREEKEGGGGLGEEGGGGGLLYILMTPCAKLLSEYPEVMFCDAVSVHSFPLRLWSFCRRRFWDPYQRG